MTWVSLTETPPVLTRAVLLLLNRDCTGELVKDRSVDRVAVSRPAKKTDAMDVEDWVNGVHDKLEEVEVKRAHTTCFA